MPFVDSSLYVMTPEFGAASQLEKIDMLDFADTVAINKFERGAKDAMRDVGRQMVRNREAFGKQPSDMPVFGTSAATFNDDGVTALYQHLRDQLAGQGLPVAEGALPHVDVRHSSGIRQVVPTDRVRYLAEITETVRGYHQRTEEYAAAASRVQRFEVVQGEARGGGRAGRRVGGLLDKARKSLCREVADQIQAWPAVVASYSGDEQVVKVRDKEVCLADPRVALGQQDPPRLAPPLHRPRRARPLLAAETCRASSPSPPVSSRSSATARTPPDVRRRGDPFRTNRRFKLLSADGDATKAFDRVRLGHPLRPRPRPPPRRLRQGRHLGVSVATLDDMKALYDGFDLVSPSTSVSMTINGPAPTVLAFFLNTVIDQQVDAFRDKEGRDPDEAEHAELAAYALANVRGTVQADILKEDDRPEHLPVLHRVLLADDGRHPGVVHPAEGPNFYSVSISGYHIAEAGANPISQLAFTLANGFTYVEAYLAAAWTSTTSPQPVVLLLQRHGPEYTVLGRVARRIWAITMKEKYGANERSQKLKYHVQTSGRSLHAQEMDFNDIRTTLQALIAIYDNANSLHTTPTTRPSPPRPRSPYATRARDPG